MDERAEKWRWLYEQLICELLAWPLEHASEVW